MFIRHCPFPISVTLAQPSPLATEASFTGGSILQCSGDLQTRGGISIFFDLVLGIPLLCCNLHSTSVTAAFCTQLRRKLCVSEESGLPAHSTRTPHLLHCTLSRMLEDAASESPVPG